ncbi:MAG: transglutaminase-like domain-containing protein [Aphanocapsa sp. GSE-SYN-MK-11-07L]|jgi:transglutaminase-like putative cysteine protease|nr:transglutaminase-like domain-containing protein [Aphanocapsa sp. GSE-SYN-MK-11-07L]
MKLPPLLLGSTLLFWGWQTGLWLVAVPLAIAVEAQPFVDKRWDLSADQFRQIFRSCLLIGSLLLILILITQRSPNFIYTFLKGLPPVFWPLVAAQAYSNRDRICFRDLLPVQSKRQAGQHQPSWLDRSFHLTLPYFFVCLLSASAANSQGYLFYLCMGGLIAWMLWSGRPSRSSPAFWLCLILLASGMGWIGHQGLHQLHAAVEQRAINWLNPFNNQSADPLRSNTRIGDIGLLKLSDEIVFRVAPGDRQTFPILLREATYNKYQSSTWIASKPQFMAVHPANGGTNWQLGKGPQNSSWLKISTTLNRGSELLSLPQGSFQLNQLPVEKMEQNQYGVVKVEGKPGAIAYQVQFDQQRSWDSPPTPADLQVPEAEKPAVDQVLQQLELEGKSPEEVLNRLSGFFQTNFQYSLKLADRSEQSTPIADFLLKNRVGHCEYFATATTLMLREAGIPARYATGFSAHEFSELEGQYIVRGRNAHAWAIAYLNGSWQFFDTTPSAWIALEDEAASPWQRFSDLWSFVAFKFSTELHFGNSNQFNPVAWLTLPLLVILLWQFRRILRLRRTAHKAIPIKSIAQTSKVGSDSEFYLIEQALTEIGLDRRTDESLQLWLRRLRAELTNAQWNDLCYIIKLHYRYRFDPNGVCPSDRLQLKTLSQLWLHEYYKSQSSH